ncbi:hypothetical protein, partial [Spirosoma harenae]
MADVTLLSTPDLHALAKAGRTTYRFEGAGRYQTLGVKAVNALGFNQAVPDGTIITLQWGEKTYTLTARTVPAAQGEFPAGDGSAEYVDNLADHFAHYFPIREDFTVSRSTVGLVKFINFTAKQAGKAYNMTAVLPGGAGSPYYALGRTTDGADPLIRTQYSIYTEIWLQNPGTDGTDLAAHYTRINQAYLETDANGDAEINVGNILYDWLTADLPSWSFLNPTVSQFSARKYYVTYGEAWGFPLQVGQIKADQVRYIYLGGADYVHKGLFGYELLQFSGSAGANKALRFGAQTRYILADEPQFLTFVNLKSTPLAMNLVATMTFDDDETLELEEL